MAEKKSADPEKTNTDQFSTRKHSLKDTTRHRKAEKELCDFEPYLSDIIQLIPDPVMVIDNRGKVAAWNRAMEDLTGVPATDILRKGNYEYALPFYGKRRPVLADIAMRPAEEIEKMYKHITRRGNTLIAEATVTHLPHGPAQVYGSATTLKDRNGKIVGALEIVCEIS